MRTTNFVSFFTLLLILLLIQSVTAAETIDISGKWNFSLDRGDVGIAEKWFEKRLTEKIYLPGVLQSQGFGDDISTKTPWVLSLYDKNWFLREEYEDFTKEGNVKVPFLSQPPKHYLGAAWYQKEIEIPINWQNKRVVLFLERPKWKSTVYIDGREIGSNLSLVADHEYDLGNLSAGKHLISIRVDNRMLMDYRPDAHSVSDSLGMSWNGIVGKMELRATSNVWIEDVQIFPNVEKKSAFVKVKIGNSTNREGSGAITAKDVTQKIIWGVKGGFAELTVNFPKDTQNWSEFIPYCKNYRFN